MENLIRLGRVEAVNLAARPAPLVRVRTGELLTDWLPAIAIGAGCMISWDPPIIGQAAILLSSSGETGAGFALLGLNIDGHESPDDSPDRVSRRLPDASVFEYDFKKSVLRIVLPAAGRTEIVSPAGILLTGDITVNGSITSSGDVTGSGISLVNHRHMDTAGLGAGETTPALK